MSLCLTLVLLPAACTTVKIQTPGQPKELGAAKAAAEQWAGPVENPAARDRYNTAVEDLVEWYDAIPLDERAEACRKAGLKVELDSSLQPGMWNFTLARKVPLRRVKHTYTRPGIGVPVVVNRPNDCSQPLDIHRPPEGISLPSTALLEQGSSGAWVLHFHAVTERETVMHDGREQPLAANFTAPLASLGYRAEALRKSGRSGMLNPTRSKRKEKLYLMQPYDPNRIPLLMVHGLQSTPVAFLNLFNDLMADPVIRDRYQVWHYHYPTGLPTLLNAAVFREVLNKTLKEIDPEGDDFATSHLVVMGHSMGGILSHTLVCDSGSQLWDAVIRVRPEKLAPSSPGLQTVRDTFIFRRDRRVQRVIFVAVPHRGSSFADNWVGDVGQQLYRGDSKVLDAFALLLKDHRDQVDPFLVGLLEQKKLSSIRTLSGKSPALVALANIPPAVPFHSITGQQKAGPKLTGSDGIVPYSSSHLEGAESELVVQSGHNAFRHPDSVAEIKRILHTHLQDRQP